VAEQMQASTHRKPEYPVEQGFATLVTTGDVRGRASVYRADVVVRGGPMGPLLQHHRGDFLYARRHTPGIGRSFLDLLIPATNAGTRAAVLILIVSKTTMDYNGQPSVTHTFDTGAAWETWRSGLAQRPGGTRYAGF